MKGGIGLTKVPDAELETLLRWIHRGEQRLPIRRSDFLASGLPYLSEYGDLLQGLDEPGARAVLVAVLAERRKAARTAARPE